MKLLQLPIYVGILFATFTSCDSGSKPADEFNNDSDKSSDANESEDHNLLVGEWQTPDFNRIKFRRGGTFNMFNMAGDDVGLEGRYTIVSENTMNFETAYTKDELYYNFPDDNTLFMGDNKESAGEFRRIIE